MKTISTLSIGAVALLTTSVTFAQGWNMMNGGNWGGGWMGGYGGPWMMILLVIVVAALVAWIVKRGGK